jgi:hypothetical protein
MKRIFALALVLIFITGSAFCQSYSGIKRGGSSASSLEPETLTYLALPGVTLTTEEIAVLNSNIRLIKNGRTITLLAQTVNISNPAGGPLFLSNPLTDLRWMAGLGWYLTLTENTNTLKVLVGAAGTGETLDAELLTAVTNYVTLPFDTFITSGKDVTSAIKLLALGQQVALNNSITVATGALYKVVTDLTLSSGTAPLYELFWNESSWEVSFSIPEGASSKYQTVISNGELTYAGALDASGYVTNFSLTQSLKKVLTPSATGVTFSSPTVTGTFNYAATSYTLSISKL